MEYKEHEESKPAKTRQIGKLIETNARRFAAFLTAQSERLSIRRKKIIALVFGLLAVVASVSLLVSPLATPAGNSIGKARPPVERQGTSPAGDPDSHASSRRDSFDLNDPIQSMRMIKRWLKRCLDSLAER